MALEAPHTSTCRSARCFLPDPQTARRETQSKAQPSPVGICSQQCLPFAKDRNSLRVKAEQKLHLNYLVGSCSSNRTSPTYFLNSFAWSSSYWPTVNNKINPS